MWPGSPLWIVLAATACAQPPAFGPPVTFTGMCDASAAVIQNGRVLVIDDEDQETTYLRTYRLTAGGAPVSIARLAPAALALDPKHPEMDLEAASVVGPRLYLMGSHSRSRTGKLRPSRQRLFAVDWPPTGATAKVRGRPYTSLIPDLQAYLRASSSPALRNLVLDNGRPPKEGGVSIEGMAAAPGGGLLIGFRSPLCGRKALTVVLRRPGAFASPALLDLGGDGVRDIIWDADAARYLVLSGPVGPGGSFGLYAWRGDPATAPVLLMRSSSRHAEIDFSASPEALALDPATHSLWLLFDEGSACSSQKRFRGIALKNR